MKICPSCNAEVPAVANLCKHCLHDFHVVVPQRKSPLWTILFLAVGTALVSAMAFGYIQSQRYTQKISVDQETRSIVFTTRWADRTEADRVYFKDVDKIEYRKNAQPRPFEIAVITNDGDRFVYQQSGEALDYQAKQLSDMVGQQYVIIDEYDGPGKRSH